MPASSGSTSGPPAPAIAVSSSSLSHRYAPNPDRFPSPSNSYGTSSRSATPSVPMSIPQSQRESPPPPLPPPKNLEQFGLGLEHQPPPPLSSPRNAWSAPNTAPIKPGSSLLGGHLRRTYSGTERIIELDRDQLRESASNTSALLSPRILQQSHATSAHADGLGHRSTRSDLHENLKAQKHMGERSLDISRQAYDQSLLSKIGSRTSSPPSHLSPVTTQGEFSAADQSAVNRLNGQTRPVTLPERRHSSIDESLPRASGAHGGQSSGLSPGLSAVKSPLSDSGDNYTTTRQWPDMANAGAENSGPSSVTKSKDGADQSNSPTGSGDEYFPGSRTGQKRRAMSPPQNDVLDPSLRGNSESWHRHQIAKTQHSQPDSLSSSIASRPHNGSLASSYNPSMPSTAATSYQSEQFSPPVPAKFESPSNLNAASDTQQSARSYPESSPSSAQQPGQQQQHSPAQQQHVQGPPQSSLVPPMPHRRQASSGVQRAPGLWICDCCPKKPKKFESEEDLRIHEMEKQYVCQYCNNRFKNKNEAERHQNSLHLRRHSWSCAALTSFESAFHPTPQSNTNAAMSQSQGYPNSHTATDTCGYCGQEFANPPNWDDRVGHLNHVHKFGECNQSKKFYRADHFRQHLKHSHAGASGKWTNVLEIACMKEEPPPQPINMQQGMAPPMHPSMHQQMGQPMHQGMPQHMPQGMQPGMQQPPPMAPMVAAQQQGYPQDLRRINEVPNEQ